MSETTDDSEKLLQLFIDQAPVAIAMFDKEMRYIASSRRWLSDYGLGNQNLYGVSHYDVFPDIPERWREVHRRGLAGEVITSNDDSFVRADGRTQWLRWEVRPWYSKAGLGGIIIFAEDITEQKQAEDRLRVIVESTPNALVMVDEHGLIVLVNKQLEHMFGYDRSELLGQPLEILVPQHLHAVHRGHVRRYLEELSERPMGATRDLFGLHKDGSLVPVEIGLAPITSEAGGRVLASIIDITERKHAEERILQLNTQLEQRVRERTSQLEESVNNLKQSLVEADMLRKELREQAIRDPLTGMFNRRFLEESLKHEVSRANRTPSALGIIMFDMDNFKYLNDQFGHVAGDEVLHQVGRVLLTQDRAADIACRYGGDEFIIVLPDTSLENARHKAEQLREQLKLLRIHVNDMTLPDVEFSIGVAAFPEHGSSEIELLQSVDAALYRAKQEGGDRVVVADQSTSTSP